MWRIGWLVILVSLVVPVLWQNEMALGFWVVAVYGFMLMVLLELIAFAARRFRKQ